MNTLTFAIATPVRPQEAKINPTDTGDLNPFSDMVGEALPVGEEPSADMDDHASVQEMPLAVAQAVLVPNQASILAVSAMTQGDVLPDNVPELTAGAGIDGIPFQPAEPEEIAAMPPGSVSYLPWQERPSRLAAGSVPASAAPQGAFSKLPEVLGLPSAIITPAEEEAWKPLVVRVTAPPIQVNAEATQQPQPDLEKPNAFLLLQTGAVRAETSEAAGSLAAKPVITKPAMQAAETKPAEAPPVTVAATGIGQEVSSAAVLEAALKNAAKEINTKAGIREDKARPAKETGPSDSGHGGQGAVATLMEIAGRLGAGKEKIQAAEEAKALDLSLAGAGKNDNGAPSAIPASAAADSAKAAEASFARILRGPVHVPAAEQVLVHLSNNLKNGERHFTIRLDPEHLGRVEVRMEIGADGRTGVTMIAEHKETLDLLQRDARQLERALADAGLKTDSSSLSFNLRQQHGEGQAARQEGRSAFFRETSEPAEIVLSIPLASGGAVAARSGLDIKV